MDQGVEDENIIVHAGFPNPGTDKSLLSLDLNQLLLPNPVSSFLFRIKGNEWAELGIFDQDIAIIDRAATPKGSDLVIWWNNQGQFSISKLADMPGDSIIWGIATAVIHQFRKLKR
jgi:SOS-response transcriptional repressor LexA